MSTSLFQITKTTLLALAAAAILAGPGHTAPLHAGQHARIIQGAGEFGIQPQFQQQQPQFLQQQPQFQQQQQFQQRQQQFNEQERQSNQRPLQLDVPVFHLSPPVHTTIR